MLVVPVVLSERSRPRPHRLRSHSQLPDRQTWFVPQATHSNPEKPHAEDELPPVQTPVAGSQHPVSPHEQPLDTVLHSRVFLSHA